MEAPLVTSKMATFALKASVMKFGFLQKFSLAIYIKGAKFSFLLLGGMMYKSSMTSFLINKVPAIPDSIHAKMEAAKSYIRPAEKKKTALNLSENEVISEEIPATTNDMATCGPELINKKDLEDFTSDFAQSEIEPSSARSQDILEVALNELIDIKDEVISDATEGFLGGLEKAGLKYLDSTFREQDVHRSLISLINDLFKARPTIEESREYGISLMNGVVKDKKFIQNTKKLSLDVVKHESVKQASISLMKHCVNHTTAQHYAKVLLTDAVIKTQALDVMISSITDAVIKAVQKPETNSHLGLMMIKIIKNEEVANEAKDSLIYSNLTRRVSFSSNSDKENSYKLSESLEQRIDSWFQERNTL
ncbi:unnamed protein product [Moneuplotes crassus]|uniref:Uncharacterized protein n=1 Tax=Euplotes crassus TaxID=5936 RepID=A0AAD1XF24_EUPCR|nr:unnamed protein product [Moneuplotes crassus]